MVDVIVVGSGAAGLVAALVAAKQGASVLVIEKSRWLGGTSAISGGGIWIPCNHLAAAAGLHDSPAEARTYIEALVGEGLRTDVLDAFIAAGPEMLEFLEREDAGHFRIAPQFGDLHPYLPGANKSGRLLNPVEYDGRKLGSWFRKLRLPRAEFNAPGGMMLAIEDLPHIKAFKSSPRSFFYLSKVAARFAVDRLKGYGRGTRLTMGNAMQANLLRAVIDAGVDIRTESEVVDLLTADGRVTGVAVEEKGRAQQVDAAEGVILATGGFSFNETFRKVYIPYPEHHVSIMTEGNTGSGISLALKAGGRMDGENVANAVWSIISTAPKRDGTRAIYAHMLDLGKPGCIAVDRTGRRFENEAIFSGTFVNTMHRVGAVPAWLVADSRFVRKYGLGLVFSRGVGLKRLRDVGYIVEAPTLDALAAKIGVDPLGLKDTVIRLNGFADTGVDTDFHKGETSNERNVGDMKHGPNPCLGRIETPPFYAVRVTPGDGGTTAGLRIDDRARVLDANDDAIPGLYAAGLDVNAIWRGLEPARGTNIGPALTFGYIAGRDAAGQLPPSTSIPLAVESA